MSNSGFAQLRIRLAQLGMDQTNLRVEASGLCRSIGTMLMPELCEIEEMEISKAAGLMDELVMKQAELLSLERKIYELEKALGK
jgi:hypothetical protein